MRLVWMLAGLGLAGCGGTPVCVPEEAAYRVCDDDRVFECPAETAAQATARAALIETCEGDPDPTGCAEGLAFEEVDMEEITDCTDEELVCVVASESGREASCVDQ